MDDMLNGNPPSLKDVEKRKQLLLASCEHQADLATNFLGVEGVTALALVHIHQLAAGILDSSWRCVDTHKHTHVEVHAQRHHGHNVTLVSVCMALHSKHTGFIHSFILQVFQQCLLGTY